MLKKVDPVERILLRHKKVTPKAMEEIKASHLHKGAYLGKTLIDHGYLHVQTLLDTLSEELRLPCLKLADFPKDHLPVEGLNISGTFLKEKVIFPLKQENQTLTLAVFDPFDLATLENLKTTQGKNIDIVLSSEQDILDADMEDMEHIRDMAPEAPVIKLVNHIISQAIEMRASDIHFEPFADDLHLRYRIDGMLHEFEAPPKRLNSAIVTRIKIMAKLDISERRLPQDGRIKLKILGKDIDIRVSTLPTLFGESVVMRILDRGNLSVNLEHLGFPVKPLQQLEALIHKPCWSPAPPAAARPPPCTPPWPKSTRPTRKSSPSKTPSNTRCAASTRSTSNRRSA